MKKVGTKQLYRTSQSTSLHQIVCLLPTDPFITYTRMTNYDFDRNRNKKARDNSF
jgi:hypothetical protein